MSKFTAPQLTPRELVTLFSSWRLCELCLCTLLGELNIRFNHMQHRKWIHQLTEDGFGSRANMRAYFKSMNTRYNARTAFARYVTT